MKKDFQPSVFLRISTPPAIPKRAPQIAPPRKPTPAPRVPAAKATPTTD